MIDPNFWTWCCFCGKDTSKSDLIRIFWTLVWHFWIHALGFGILSRTRHQFPESKEPLLAWGFFESFSKNWRFSWKELQFSTGESLDLFQSQLRLKTGSMIFENHPVKGNLFLYWHNFAKKEIKKFQMNWFWRFSITRSQEKITKKTKRQMMKDLDFISNL